MSDKPQLRTGDIVVSERRKLINWNRGVRPEYSPFERVSELVGDINTSGGTCSCCSFDDDNVLEIWRNGERVWVRPEPEVRSPFDE